MNHEDTKVDLPPSKIMILACATVIEEILPVIPPGMRYEEFDFGRHNNPDELKKSLQLAIDSVPNYISHIILGYGLCSQAVVGLKTDQYTLVIPRVDDCISIFLGSAAARREQNRINPGTYYLTKGWIEAGDAPFEEYDSLVKKYGPDRARRIMSQILNHYTRLAFINTGPRELEKYRAQAQEMAQKSGLNFEEIIGSDTLIKKMLYGSWDDDFIIVKPGGTVLLEYFMRDRTSVA